MFRLSTTSPTKLSLSGGLGRIRAITDTGNRLVVAFLIIVYRQIGRLDSSQTGLEQQQRALGSGLHHEIVVKEMSAASLLLVAFRLLAKQATSYHALPCHD